MTSKIFLAFQAFPDSMALQTSKIFPASQTFTTSKVFLQIFILKSSSSDLPNLPGFQTFLTSKVFLGFQAFPAFPAFQTSKVFLAFPTFMLSKVFPVFQTSPAFQAFLNYKVFLTGFSSSDLDLQIFTFRSLSPYLHLYILPSPPDLPIHFCHRCGRPDPPSDRRPLATQIEGPSPRR